MSATLDTYQESIKKLAHLYGMGVFVQFVMEAKGLDITNQQMHNLQLLDALREQAVIFVSLAELDDEDDTGL